MAYCFEKAKSRVVRQRRNKVVPCITLFMHESGEIRPSASYFELSKSTRLREVRMHPHSLAWFDMVEASFPDELWSSNLRVTRGTFKYILYEIGDEISQQDTPMRKCQKLLRQIDDYCSNYR